MLSKHQKYYFLVPCKTYLIVNIRGNSDWSMKTLPPGHKGIALSRTWAPALT